MGEGRKWFPGNKSTEVPWVPGITLSLNRDLRAWLTHKGACKGLEAGAGCSYRRLKGSLGTEWTGGTRLKSALTSPECQMIMHPSILNMGTWRAGLSFRAADSVNPKSLLRA